MQKIETSEFSNSQKEAETQAEDQNASNSKQTLTSPTSKDNIFSQNYWKAALKEIKSVKVLSIAAILIALQVAISSFYIPVNIGLGTQRVFFHFIIIALGGVIYGPVCGAYVGFVADILGFLVHPQGAFFPGYTITSIVSGFTYGLFLYKNKISILRLLACKATVSLVSNVFLNALWDSVFAPSSYWVLMAARVPKNLVMLPLEVAMMVVLFNVLLPILHKSKVIKEVPFNGKISWF